MTVTVSAAVLLSVPTKLKPDVNPIVAKDWLTKIAVPLSDDPDKYPIGRYREDGPKPKPDIAPVVFENKPSPSVPAEEPKIGTDTENADETNIELGIGFSRDINCWVAGRKKSTVLLVFWKTKPEVSIDPEDVITRSSPNSVIDNTMAAFASPAIDPNVMRRAARAGIDFSLCFIFILFFWELCFSIWEMFLPNSIYS